MKRTRRTVIRNASLVTAALAGVPAVSAADAPPEWDPETVYTSGDRVVYDGAVWEASGGPAATSPEPASGGRGSRPTPTPIRSHPNNRRRRSPPRRTPPRRATP